MARLQITGNVVTPPGGDLRRQSGGLLPRCRRPVGHGSGQQHLRYADISGEKLRERRRISGGVSAGLVSVTHNTYCTSEQNVLLGDFRQWPTFSRLSRATWRGIRPPTATMPYKATDIRHTIGGGTIAYISPANADFDCLLELQLRVLQRERLRLLYGWNAGWGARRDPSAERPRASGPGFVDRTRNFYTWARSLGWTGTIPEVIADGLAKMRTANDFGSPDSGYTMDALLNYVKAGFAPSNPALHGTAHDGGDIGAIGWVPPSWRRWWRWRRRR